MMVRQAAKRNAGGIRRGQVDLRLGSAADMPAFAAPFDKVLAVNALQFWRQPIDLLWELRHVLRAGGRIAIAYQPCGSGAVVDAAHIALGRPAAELPDRDPGPKPISRT